MATSNLPSDKRRPGVFHSFDDTSGARGQVPLNRAIALVGTKSAAGSAAPLTPTQVFNEADADAAVGTGTPLALMARTAFETCRRARQGGKRLQGAPKIFVVPIADPGGTAAEFTFTATGTATEAGDVVFRISGRTLRAAVANGDSNNTVAAAMKDAIDAKLADLPVTAAIDTVSASPTPNVVDATAVVTGVNGNDITVEVLETPAGVSVATAQSVTGAGTIDITAALDALLAKDYYSVAIESHTSTDVDDLLAHMDDAWAAAKKRYRHGFIGHAGTVAAATTLSNGSDRKELVVVAWENARSLPGEIAAAVGTVRLLRERPSHNWDGTEVPLYGPDDADEFIDSEIETLLAGGATPLVTSPSGMAEVVRLVTTKTTQDGAPFENLLDLSNSWTTAFYAIQIDPLLKRAINGNNLDEDLLKLLRDITYRVLKEGEGLGDLHKVDEHKDEIIVESHPSVPTRALVEIPESVVPNAHQVDATHRLFVEGA